MEKLNEVDLLLEKMVKSCLNSNASERDVDIFIGIAKTMLPVVLSAIEDGVVVEAHAQFIGSGDVWTELKPDFKKFLENK